MNRARPIVLLLPALLLAGCCCDRSPRRDPRTIVCPSSAPAPTPDPMRVSVGAGVRMKVPESATPLAIDLTAAKPALMVVDVADLTATTPIDVLVGRLRAALPLGTEVDSRGPRAIVIRGTPEAHAKVGAWFAEMRMDALPPK